MKFYILTLFPDMVMTALRSSILGRAIEKGLVEAEAIDIRDYTLDKNRRVDDYPYGGGAGMLIQAQPVYDAYMSVKARLQTPARVVYMTPQGRLFNQQMAKEFASEQEIVLLCGHYEGIDERVIEEIVTDEVSIGDYVLTGGELAALVVADAVSRLVPGVLHNETSADTESLEDGLLEYPQYTRPEVWRDRRVPEILLSGDHAKVDAWRKEQSLLRTQERRPDLYDSLQDVGIKDQLP